MRIIFSTLMALTGCMALTPLAVSSQDSQRFPGWITGCSAGPFHGANCPAAEVGEFMTALPIGMLERDMPTAKFETFALEEVLRQMGAGVVQKATTGVCTASVQLAVRAGEILRTKVPDTPILTGSERDLFNHLVRITRNANDYIGKGC